MGKLERCETLSGFHSWEEPGNSYSPCLPLSSLRSRIPRSPLIFPTGALNPQVRFPFCSPLDGREEQGRLGGTGSERVWGGGIRRLGCNRLVLLAPQTCTSGASAAPSGAFRLSKCSQNDRLVPPGWGKGVGVKGGEPQARGSWRVKNSSSRVSVSKCGGGELEARQTGLCFPWVRE